jgi:hypothetical protein
VTTILVQVIYLFANITMSTGNPYDTFVQNTFIVKVVPLAVLSLLTFNLLFNIFVYALEIKFGRNLMKAKLILSKFMDNKKEPDTVK